MMKRLLLLSCLVYSLFLLGLGAMEGVVLLLILPMALYLIAALIFGPDKLDLKVSRTLTAERVYEDTPVSIKISIENKARTLEEVLVEDMVPRGLNPLVGETQVLVSLPPGAKSELEYTVIGRRGSFDLDLVRVTAGDRLGLFRRKAVISAPARLSVLPRPLKLRQVPIRPLRTRGYAGPIPARRAGSGVEFYGMREYQAGDPQRWINWRVSARHPRYLFSNEFEQERIADVGLILDARRRTDVRLLNDSLFEHSVAATASLAEAFLRDGNRVCLLVYGRFLDWTFPGYGKVQRERILQALARAETGESQIFEKLEYLPTRYFPAQSQLVLVSPLSGDDVPMLIRLRARGYELLVVRPDPVSFEVNALESQPSVEVAARIANVERVLLLRELQRVGIRVVDWQVDQPFDQVVHASLGRVPNWFHKVGIAP